MNMRFYRVWEYLPKSKRDNIVSHVQKTRLARSHSKIRISVLIFSLFLVFRHFFFKRIYEPHGLISVYGSLSEISCFCELYPELLSFFHEKKYLFQKLGLYGFLIIFTKFKPMYLHGYGSPTFFLVTCSLGIRSTIQICLLCMYKLCYY